MVQNQKVKKLALLFLSLPMFFSSFCFSQSKSGAVSISSLSPLWQKVIESPAVYEPLETEYGFIMAGQGKMLYAFTKKGEVVWKRSLLTNLLSAPKMTKDGFVLALTKDYVFPCRLCLLNLSGKMLWQKTLPLKITNGMLISNSGRIYGAADDALLCIGMNGFIRWCVSCPKIDSSFPLLQLPDESIFIINEEEKEGKSVGTRFDPFGNKKEEIVFLARIRQAVSCDFGLVLFFEDGTLCLLSTENGKMKDIWTLPQALSSFDCSDCRFVSKSDTTFYVLCGKTSSTCSVLDIAQGKIINSFCIPELAQGNITYQKGFLEDIVLCDRKKLVIYNAQGKRIAFLDMFTKEKWDYIFSLSPGEIILFSCDWTLSAYSIAKLPFVASSSKKTNELSKKKYISFSPLEKSNGATNKTMSPSMMTPSISSSMEEMMKKYLCQDNTKQDKSVLQKNETYWQSVLEKEIQAVANIYQDKGNSANDFYIKNPKYCSLIFDMIGIFGTGNFQDEVANILSRADDSSMLICACQAAKKIAWDPQGTLMEGLSSIVFDKTHKNDTKLMVNVCDAILSICSFNGKPPFVTTGKKLLSALMTVDFNSSINAYAKTTMTKMK